MGLLRENPTITSSKRRKTGREMKKLSQIQSGMSWGGELSMGLGRHKGLVSLLVWERKHIGK